MHVLAATEFDIAVAGATEHIAVEVPGCREIRAAVVNVIENQLHFSPISRKVSFENLFGS